MQALASSSSSAASSRTVKRSCARNAERLRSHILGVPQRPLRSIAKCSAAQTSRNLATELVQKLPAAALAGLVASLQTPDVARAADYFAPPAAETTTAVKDQQPSSLTFQGQGSASAPALKEGESGLPEGNQWRYSEFVNAVQNGKVERVRFSKDGSMLQLTAVDGRRAAVVLPNDPDLVDILAKNGVDISVSEGDQQGNYVSLLGNILFPLIAFGGLFFLFRRAQGGSSGGGGPMGGMGGPMEFGKSKSKFQEVPETGVTFQDVAGCDGAKLELQEVVDFLKNPDKYTALGAKIPKGCLLVGPPGTGKTLLAKAVAGEAGTPFFSCAASEFVELFVGVGASRVRDLFEKAKAKAPCIIFIDEIDAVGRQRGAGLGGGNDEREQTINQLLTEMDGFEGNTGVIVLAATNRPDVLDQALLRPGRFDRRVNVDLPDYNGRTAILKVHARGKPLSPDVDLESIARRTPGYSGASLQNLMNEAAIFAARKEKTIIEWEDVDAALDRLMVGLEKRGGWGDASRMKEIVAFHESGHAIAGALMPDYDMVQKVTIIPRSNGAGGLTFFAPSEQRLESGLYSRQYLEAQLAVALGGRVAEELIYGENGVTTGASNDLQQVGNIARRMVSQWGMSDKVGPLVIGGGSGGNPFMGRQMGESQDSWGPAITEAVDMEVERIVNNAYVRCKEILTNNMSLLNKLAQRLLEVESVTSEELGLMIMEQEDLWMAPYGVYDLDDQKRESMPFQDQPTPQALLGQAA